MSVRRPPECRNPQFVDFIGVQKRYDEDLALRKSLVSEKRPRRVWESPLGS